MPAQNVKPSGVLGGIVGLLGFGALAGLLVATMVTPALAVTSATAKSTIGLFENLPAFIELGTQSQQNEIYAMRDGQPVKIATIFKDNRKEVTWEQVSPFLTQAVVAGEDRRFYEHGGVDVSSIARAAVGNARSGEVQSGGSTLDMQLVKNILVTEASAITDPKQRKEALEQAKGTHLDRKLKEMKLAIGLDKRYSKKEILLGYLNIVGMGSTTYGVESAAEEYFSVSAKDVTLPQAASLIAIVQQPNLQSLNDPKNYPRNKERRDQILDAMLDLKYIDQKQHDDAVAATIESYVKLSPPISGCRHATDAKLACDYVLKLITADPVTDNGLRAEAQVRADAKANKVEPLQADIDTAVAAAQVVAKDIMSPVINALGATPAERRANWAKGGYKIYTSIDLGLQDTAQAELIKQAPPTETRFPLGATANTVEAGTGRVFVMAQNKEFDDAPEAAADSSKTAVNYTTDYFYGGSRGFTTGSTYKVFDLANWLQIGRGLNEVVDGRSPQNYQPSSFKAACDPGQIGAGFKLKNDSGSGGMMTVRKALIDSVNNAFMHMAEKQDLCAIRDTAISMGAHRADFRPLFVNPNTILGQNEQAPLTIAAAAATVGASGLHCDPIIVDKVIDPAGKEQPGQAKTCNQALTPDIAAGVADAMAGSMKGGTSYPGNPRDGVPIVGKTGTSDAADHVWIMGATTKVGTAVWTGNILGHTSLRKLSNPGTRQNYASYARFNVFKAIMAKVNTNPALKGGAFGVPSAAVTGGSALATVPDLSGQTPAQAKKLLTSLDLGYADGGPVVSAIPAGRIVNTDPAAGSKLPSGTMLKVFISDGSLTTTMPTVVGATLGAANASLATYGFNLANVSYSWIQGTAANVCTVESSNPAAGAAASKADPVTLTLYGAATASASGQFDPAPGTCPQ